MIAVAGSTGYIGGKLAKRLRADGREVRALAREPDRCEELRAAGCEVRHVDVLEPDTLATALRSVDVAYYLVHSMGRGTHGDFAKQDEEGAANFAAAASDAGVSRIVYLGGLGAGSKHLASRHKTAETLQAGRVPVVYLRAAAVIGSGSESFLTAYHLVRRLPVMVMPRWASTKTQPIAVGDVTEYLAAAADLGAPLEREIQIGGPDVTSYGGMIDGLAQALEKRPPYRIVVPVLSARLSALWIGLVTPVDAGVARPLIEGLAQETVVKDHSGMDLLPQIDRTPLADAFSQAVGDLVVRK